MMLTASAIICTRNRYQEVLHCLESLACQSRSLDEVLIVDGSDDENLERIVRAVFPTAFPKPRVVRGTKGLTRQRNQGAQLSQGDVVFFFDDDAIPSADYVATILRVFEKDAARRYGAGMGQIIGVGKPNPLDRMMQRVFFLGESHGSGRFKPSGFPSLPHGRASFLEIESLSGCAMAFRREVLNHFKFDEALTDYSYMEDDDIAWRVSRKYALFYEPAALVEHRVSLQGRMRNRAATRMLVRNHRYLYAKNVPHRCSNCLAHALSLLGVVISTIIHGDLPGALGALEGIFSRLPAPE